MRLCYLALDRPDVQFPSKELARWMQAPTIGNLEAVKRLARYLIGYGRLRQVEERSHFVVFTDSDHAGCLKARESTSSSTLFYGSSMLRSTSATQGVIALSSERVRVLRSGDVDISRTWSSRNTQRFGSWHQQKHKD